MAAISAVMTAVMLDASLGELVVDLMVASRVECWGIQWAVMMVGDLVGEMADWTVSYLVEAWAVYLAATKAGQRAASSATH